MPNSDQQSSKSLTPRWMNKLLPRSSSTASSKASSQATSETPHGDPKTISTVLVQSLDDVPTNFGAYTELYILHPRTSTNRYTTTPRCWFSIPPRPDIEQKLSILTGGQALQSFQEERLPEERLESNSDAQGIDRGTLIQTIHNAHVDRVELRNNRSPAGNSAWLLDPTAYIIEQTNVEKSDKGPSGDLWSQYLTRRSDEDPDTGVY